MVVNTKTHIHSPIVGPRPKHTSPFLKDVFNECWHWCAMGKHNWVHINNTSALDDYKINCPDCITKKKTLNLLGN